MASRRQNLSGSNLPSDQMCVPPQPLAPPPDLTTNRRFRLGSAGPGQCYHDKMEDSAA